MNTITPKTRQSMLLLVFCLLLVLFNVALAQSGGDFDLIWGAVSGGGGASAGGDNTLGGTIGQAAAGMVAGGEYSLVGGITGGGVPPKHGVYLPVVTQGE